MNQKREREREQKGKEQVTRVQEGTITEINCEILGENNPAESPKSSHS